MTRIKQGVQRILAGVTANGAGVALDVSDYRFITLAVYTTGSTTATIKFAASIKTVKPNFSISPSVTNVYDYVAITPLNNQSSSIAGSTGIALTGTDTITLYEIDTNYIHWLCPIVSGYSAGTITVEVDSCNDYSR